MTETDYERKIDQLDRLLNDPDVPMEPGRIWSLLAEIAEYDLTDKRCDESSIRSDGIARRYHLI